MNVWALADLHLALLLPDKDMAFFGSPWENYVNKIEKAWKACVKQDDLVLIAGDVSWAKDLEGAKNDLAFINSLPGKKVLLKGNHDYWWPSSSKLHKALPPSIGFVYGSCFNYNGVCVAGARLWDHPEIDYSDLVRFEKNPREKKKEVPDKEKMLAMFKKDLARLERTLESMPENSKLKIAMTHYPPIDREGKCRVVHEKLIEHHVNYCVFGHLHNIEKEKFPHLDFDALPYYLTSSDFLDFKPLKIASL